MNKAREKMRTILKFDVGADGFLKMITVLAISALLTLAVGIFFLTNVMKDLKVLS